MSRSAPYVVRAVHCGHRWLENIKPGRKHTHCWRCGEKGYGYAFETLAEQSKPTDTFQVQEDLLLHNLHLWLHRAGGDHDLALACRLAQRLPLAMSELDERATDAEFAALKTLARWFRGQRVDRRARRARARGGLRAPRRRAAGEGEAMKAQPKQPISFEEALRHWTVEELQKMAADTALPGYAAAAKEELERRGIR